MGLKDVQRGRPFEHVQTCPAHFSIRMMRPVRTRPAVDKAQSQSTFGPRGFNTGSFGTRSCKKTIFQNSSNLCVCNFLGIIEVAEFENRCFGRPLLKEKPAMETVLSPSLFYENLE